MSTPNKLPQNLSLYLRHMRYVWFVLLLAIYSCDKQSKDNHIISSDSIIKEISNDGVLHWKNKTIIGLLNFGNASQDANSNSAYITKDIQFINCIFEDSISTGNRCVFDRKIVFKDCIFKKGISFKNAEFRDNFVLKQSKINGCADFCRTIFRNDADFTGTNFMDNSLFTNAVFFMNLTLLKTFFKKDCIFHFARFNGIAKISGAYFYGYTDFSQIFSAAMIDFSFCNFLHQFTITNSTIIGDMLFSDCKFKGKVSFSKNNILGEIKSKNIEGKFPDIDKIRLSNNLKSIYYEET